MGKNHRKVTLEVKDGKRILTPSAKETWYTPEESRGFVPGLDQLKPFAILHWDGAVVYTTKNSYQNHYNVFDACPQFYFFSGKFKNRGNGNTCLGTFLGSLSKKEHQQFVDNYDEISKLIGIV